MEWTTAPAWRLPDPVSDSAWTRLSVVFSGKTKPAYDGLKRNERRCVDLRTLIHEGVGVDMLIKDVDLLLALAYVRDDHGGPITWHTLKALQPKLTLPEFLLSRWGRSVEAWSAAELKISPSSMCEEEAEAVRDAWGEERWSEVFGAPRLARERHSRQREPQEHTERQRVLSDSGIRIEGLRL